MIKIANNLKFMILKQAAATPVAEELVGDQDELDVNNNEQLDAEDFELLRAKKSDLVLKETDPMKGLILGGLAGAAGGYFASDEKDTNSLLAKKNNIRNAIIASLLGAGVGSRLT